MNKSEDGKPPGEGQPPPPRYFERPAPGETRHSLLETVVIVLSTHLGVRSADKREEDFRRANGLHLFIAGVFYFAVVVAGLIALVNWIVP